MEPETEPTTEFTVEVTAETAEEPMQDGSWEYDCNGSVKKSVRDYEVVENPATGQLTRFNRDGSSYPVDWPLGVPYRRED